MKQYLTGILALGLAISAFAFTERKGSPYQIAETKGEPCGAASKQWFLISLDCNSQVQVSDVRNPLNYQLSSTQGVTVACAASTCVCAILACPQTLGGQTKPIINSSAIIYTNLYNYFNFGMTYGDIAIKDQQNNERRF